MELFPQRLKQLRQRRGLNCAMLSDLCGLHRNAVSRYEHGERLPSLESLIALANFFGCSTDYLLGLC